MDNLQFSFILNRSNAILHRVVFPFLSVIFVMLFLISGNSVMILSISDSKK
jgi:hypothetical protein